MSAEASDHDAHSVPTQDQLSLTPTPPSLSHCWIEALPNEIIEYILHHVAPTQGIPVAVKMCPLRRVCRKWRDIYDPIMFQTIKVHATTARGHDPAASRHIPRLQHILHMLQRHPHLKSYPKFIDLKIHEANITVSSLVTTIVQLCPSIQEVDLACNYDEYPEDVLSACSILPELQYMSLQGAEFRDPGPSLSNIFSLPLCLDDLKIERYGLEHSDLDDTSWVAPEVLYKFKEPKDDRELLLPLSRYHTSHITTLQLIHPCCRLNATEHILRWPTRLTSLIIADTPDWEDSNHFTLPAMQKLLDIHRSSLKYISIGEIYSEDRNIEWAKSGSPDFSSFPCLERLVMKASNIVTNDNPLVAARKLSAPQLQLVIFDFGLGESSYCDREDFLQEQAMWFELFARFKLKQYPDSKLGEIDVLFDPDVDPDSACDAKQDLERQGLILDEESDPTTWPWLYVERALNAMKEYGLKLNFRAQWNKKHWKRLIHEIETGGSGMSDSGSDNFWEELDSGAILYNSSLFT